jgi:hypothetical protein
MNKRIVFSVIKNGIINGYPFVESYMSWLSYCDEIFILDGGSTDGTIEILNSLTKISKKFKFEVSKWPSSNIDGSSIAIFTNECLDIVKSRADYLTYIQADEIFEKNDRQEIFNFKGDIFQVNKYVLFWNTFSDIINFDLNSNDIFTRWTSIRCFRSDLDINSIGDGLTFKCYNNDVEIYNSNSIVYHYGWNFPKNILQKHISHMNLYNNSEIYKLRGLLSKYLLKNEFFSNRYINILDKQYLKFRRDFNSLHPNCVRHLVDQTYYNPYLGVSLLQNGIRW